MPCLYQDKTVPELRHKCKKRGIRLTKQTGGYRTKDSLIRSLIKYKKDKKDKKDKKEKRAKRYRRQFGGDNNTVQAVLEDGLVFFYNPDNPQKKVSFDEIKQGETTLETTDHTTITCRMKDINELHSSFHEFQAYFRSNGITQAKVFPTSNTEPQSPDLLIIRETTGTAVGMEKNASKFQQSNPGFTLLTKQDYDVMIRTKG
jgi:hypothetical protein